MFYYSAANLLRIVIHYSKNSDSLLIFSSESVRVVNSLQIAEFTTHTVFSMSGSLGEVQGIWAEGTRHQCAGKWHGADHAGALRGERSQGPEPFSIASKSTALTLSDKA